MARKIIVGDCVRITKDGTSTLLPPDTGYHEKLLLEDAGRKGIVTGISSRYKDVLRVRWNPGSYRILDDFVLGALGHLEVRDKGRVDMGTIESYIHTDRIEVVSTPDGSAPRTQSSLCGVPRLKDHRKQSNGLSIWRKLFGLCVPERKQCYVEMMEFIHASMPAANGLEASMRATLRTAEKWGISAKRAHQILNEGQEKGWD